MSQFIFSTRQLKEPIESHLVRRQYEDQRKGLYQHLLSVVFGIWALLGEAQGLLLALLKADLPLHFPSSLSLSRA